MAKAEKKEKTISVTLVRSPIGYSKRQKATVRALGLRHMHHTVEHADTPALRGMLVKISHLIHVDEKSKQ